MEIFLLLLVLFLMLCGFGLLIWLIVLQERVSNLSGSMRRLTNLVKNLEQELLRSDIKNVSDVQGKQPQINTNPVNKIPKTIPAASVSPVDKKNTEEYQATPKVESTFNVQHEIYSTKDNSDFDFQKAFLGNIFNKIGAVAIIIATIIFIKLVSPFIVLTPVMKIVLGFIAGCGMVCGALYMHRTEKLKNYSEVLLGTGFAVLFITDYCAYAMFHLFNAWATSVVGGLFMIASYFIADKMKTLSMLIIGLIGAYLTPFFAGHESNLVMSYLIFINMISLIFTIRNKKTNYINIVNLLITMFVYTAYQMVSPINISYPIVLWLVYIVYDLVRDKNNNIDTILCYINYAVLTFFSTVVFKDSYFALGCMLGFTALVYGVLSCLSRYVKGTLYKLYDYSVLINIGLFIYFICNDIVSVISWSIIALGVSGLIVRFKTDYLKGAVAGYYFMAFVGAVLAKDGGTSCFMAHYFPIFNIRSMVFLLPALMMLTSGIYVLKNNSENLRNTLVFGGVSLAYLYVVGEIGSLIGQFADKSNKFVFFNQVMLYVITGFVYMLHTRRLSNIFKSILLEFASYLIGIVSLGALICFSYMYPEGFVPFINLRFAAYVFAIVTCLVHAKWTKEDAYKYIAVILGFFLCHSECVGIVNAVEGFNYLISVGWVVYSGLTTIIGILKNKKYLINTGIVLSILSILRIFLYDLANVDGLYKLIAFLVLGIILMLVSYIYTSNKKNK